MALPACIHKSAFHGDWTFFALIAAKLSQLTLLIYDDDSDDDDGNDDDNYVAMMKIMSCSYKALKS